MNRVERVSRALVRARWERKYSHLTGFDQEKTLQFIEDNRWWKSPYIDDARVAISAADGLMIEAPEMISGAGLCVAKHERR